MDVAEPGAEHDRGRLCELVAIAFGRQCALADQRRVSQAELDVEPRLASLDHEAFAQLSFGREMQDAEDARLDVDGSRTRFANDQTLKLEQHRKEQGPEPSQRSLIFASARPQNQSRPSRLRAVLEVVRESQR